MTRIHSRKKSRRRVSRRRVSRRRVSRRRVSRRRVSRRRVSRRRVSRRRVSRRRVSRKKHTSRRKNIRKRMHYRMGDSAADVMSSAAQAGAMDQENDRKLAIWYLQKIKDWEKFGGGEPWVQESIKNYEIKIKNLAKKWNWGWIEMWNIKKDARREEKEDDLKSLTINTNRCEHGISGCTGGECDECTARIQRSYW